MIADQGEVPLAILYATDARAGKNIDIVGKFPDTSHSPISYQLALVKDHSQSAVSFFEFLQSPAALAIFKVHGFLAPN